MDRIDLAFSRRKNSHLGIKKELCLNITPELDCFIEPLTND